MERPRPLCDYEYREQWKLCGPEIPNRDNIQTRRLPFGPVRRVFPKDVERRFDDHIHRNAGHAAVVGLADRFLARAAIHIDANDAPAFVRPLTVSRGRRPHDADDRHVKGHGYMAWAGIVAYK